MASTHRHLWYHSTMTLKAHLHDGRFGVEEPVGDGLDAGERVALHHALVASQEDVESGQLVDAEEILRELREP